MECLCHVNLPCLCLDRAYHPSSSMTLRAPITAPKRGQIPSKKLDFPLSPNKWVVRDAHSLELHMECFCHVNLPFLCLDRAYQPSMTLGAPSQPQNEDIYPQKNGIFLCQVKERRRESTFCVKKHQGGPKRRRHRRAK